MSQITRAIIPTSIDPILIERRLALLGKISDDELLLPDSKGLVAEELLVLEVGLTKPLSVSVCILLLSDLELLGVE